jgi:hypothetical protein
VRVLENARPIEQRVSALDRLPSVKELEASLFRLTPRLDPNSVKLALDVGDTRVFIGRSADGEDLFYFFLGSGGGGGSGGPRTGLATRGVKASWSQDSDRSFAFGIVADDVLAVRVADSDAVLQNNAFLAEAPVGSQMVLTLAAGNRVVDFPVSPTARH